MRGRAGCARAGEWRGVLGNASFSPLSYPCFSKSAPPPPPTPELSQLAHGGATNYRQRGMFKEKSNPPPFFVFVSFSRENRGTKVTELVFPRSQNSFFLEMRNSHLPFYLGLALSLCWARLPLSQGRVSGVGNGRRKTSSTSN